MFCELDVDEAVPARKLVDRPARKIGRQADHHLVGHEAALADRRNPAAPGRGRAAGGAAAIDTVADRTGDAAHVGQAIRDRIREGVGDPGGRRIDGRADTIGARQSGLKRIAKAARDRHPEANAVRRGRQLRATSRDAHAGAGRADTEIADADAATAKTADTSAAEALELGVSIDRRECQEQERSRGEESAPRGAGPCEVPARRPCDQIMPMRRMHRAASPEAANRLTLNISVPSG